MIETDTEINVYFQINTFENYQTFRGMTDKLHRTIRFTHGLYGSSGENIF